MEEETEEKEEKLEKGEKGSVGKSRSKKREFVKEDEISNLIS
jgi:hypothetical protein